MAEPSRCAVDAVCAVDGNGKRGGVGAVLEIALLLEEGAHINDERGEAANINVQTAMAIAIAPRSPASRRMVLVSCRPRISYPPHRMVAVFASSFR